MRKVYDYERCRTVCEYKHILISQQFSFRLVWKKIMSMSWFLWMNAVSSHKTSNDFNSLRVYTSEVQMLIQIKKILNRIFHRRLLFIYFFFVNAFSLECIVILLLQLRSLWNTSQIVIVLLCTTTFFFKLKRTFFSVRLISSLKFAFVRIS